MEVNQNWLAGQVEVSERVRELEGELAALRAKLAIQANKLRAYELVESRLWRELVAKKEAKGE